MGKYAPKPYKVKRNGEWVTINPEPVDYKKEPLKAVQITPNGLKKSKHKKKR